MMGLIWSLSCHHPQESQVKAGLEGILSHRTAKLMLVPTNSLHTENSLKLLTPDVCSLAVFEGLPNITALSHLP